MAYRFGLDEPLTFAIRRISVEQIDKAARNLTALENEATGILETRKALKRIRSLLHLTRFNLGEKIFRRENDRIRSIAQSLSRARDCHAMIETLAKLQATNDTRDFMNVAKIIRPALNTRAAEIDTQTDGDLIGSAIEELNASRNIYVKLPVKKTNFSRTEQGLEKTYAKCRGTMTSAYGDLDPQYFHEWRKTVQRHWRQMKLMSSAWPELSEIRILNCRQLALLLGEHNDVDILENYVRDELQDAIPPAKAEPFFEICLSRKSRYRTMAHPLGKRLFGERPENFTERISTYWKSAKEMKAVEPRI